MQDEGPAAAVSAAPPLIGVLALQGAFEEHQKCLEAVGCRTRQVRTPEDLVGLEGIVLPGGESTAMGLIGTASASASSSLETEVAGSPKQNMWEALQEFASASTSSSTTKKKPVWGTCAGMILLAERCIGTSAVIEDGQSLIGGIDITVVRNYFGSQISSFEMSTPAPPSSSSSPSDNHHNGNINENADAVPFPGVFIRAPAILSVSPDVKVLGKVTAIPCRQAAATLSELERKIAMGENVIKMGIVGHDARRRHQHATAEAEDEKEEKDGMEYNDGSVGGCTGMEGTAAVSGIVLPGAAPGTNAREVICAARKDNLLCTAFHPELTDDVRWHEYFVNMVNEARQG